MVFLPTRGHSILKLSNLDQSMKISDLDSSGVRPLPLVAVIVPTHNRWTLAEEAVRSLLEDDYSRKIIYLIDDGSIDGTSIICHQKYPQVKIHQGDGHLWWSGAINQGIELALSDNVDLILWLNDDNKVDRSTIREMVEVHELSGDDSIIAARTLSTVTGEAEWEGDPPRWHPSYGHWSPAPATAISEPLPTARRIIEHPPGGRGVLFPIACFRRVGLIDQKNFPHYWADHDFHYRAMKSGYRYFLAERAVVWNRPNRGGEELNQAFSIRWCLHFLFARRSPMNLPTLRRLLRRHLTAREYREIWNTHLRQTLFWLSSGWVNRHPLIHKIVKTTWRRFNPLQQRRRDSC
jgi:GT2 family glycosyltransferase